MSSEPQLSEQSDPAGGVAAPDRRLLLSLVFLCVVVFLFERGFSYLIREIAPEGNDLRALVVLQQLVGGLLPVVLFVKLLRLPPTSTFGLLRPRIGRALLAVPLGFVAIVAINLVLPQLIPPSAGYVQKDASIVAFGDTGELLSVIVTICFVAPLADELFFRGLLLRSLASRFGSVAAVLATAVLTALFHSLEPFKLAHAFLMGAIFATAGLWTRSVYTCLVLHALNNSMALLPQG